MGTKIKVSGFIVNFFLEKIYLHGYTPPPIDITHVPSNCGTLNSLPLLFYYRRTTSKRKFKQMYLVL
jgi:hypothetical protein